MIEFNGNMSDACKQFMIKMDKRYIIIILLIASLFVIIPIIIFAVMWDGLCALFLIVFVVMFLFVIFYKYPKEKYSFIIPDKIVIDKDIMYSESKDFYCSRDPFYIKIIIDYGEWYHIKFILPLRSKNFVCEKALITQGTIEEFEKMFEGKIKRKYK